LGNINAEDVEEDEDNDENDENDEKDRRRGRGRGKKRADEVILQQRIKQVQKLIGNLRSAPFKNNVMVECMEVFYDKRFKEKLDANPHLIAFNNGVYDLKLNVFRPGRPEDFISRSMPIDYKVFTDDDEKVQKIHRFLEQVFPDKEIRHYFMDVSSEVFEGGNFRKIVQFWTGTGDNGKSMTQKFFELMLGQLSIKFSTTIVTGKKPMIGAANAELSRCGNGVRMAVIEEPDADEMINIGALKHLSGNDSIPARDLFQKGKDMKEISPMFKLIFICNSLPKMKSADMAVFNRPKVIPFESTFCRPSVPAPDTYEEQLLQKRFPMDTDFIRKIPDLVEAFAWVLLEHRRKGEFLKYEPEKVLQATEEYRRENDTYRQFIEESIIDNDENILSLMELYSSFREWYRDGYPGQQIPIKQDVESYFVKLWGKPQSGKRWQGYGIRTLQDKIEANEVVKLTRRKKLENEKEKEKEHETSAIPPI
jgi:P4 family phage/plasmid primase-like protien